MKCVSTSRCVQPVPWFAAARLPRRQPADLLQLGARPSNPSEPDVLTASVARLRDEVGWAPARSREAAIAETVGWWREQRAAG